MANTKISALTSATTPLGGTEVLPIVQSNVTKKVSVADLTAARAGTYTQGTTTPSVSSVSYMFIANSAPTTITNFTGGQAGQVIYLLFNDANTTINRSNAYLAGGTNFVSTANDTLTLVSDGTYWYEIARSANS